MSGLRSMTTEDEGNKSDQLQSESKQPSDDHPSRTGKPWLTGSARDSGAMTELYGIFAKGIRYFLLRNRVSKDSTMGFTTASSSSRRPYRTAICANPNASWVTSVLW